MRKLLYCITAFLVATFFACSDSERNHQILLQAENCIEASPDSALAILEGIKYNDITSPENRAVYSLLYTQARYKLMDIPETDSLIDLAISFFKANGDDQRLATAYYYKGAVNYDRKEYEISMENLKEAEMLAVGPDDELLKNKIYELLGYVNHSSGNKELTLKYSKCFLESSLRLKQPDWIINSLIMVSAAFSALSLPDSSELYLKRILEMPELQNMSDTMLHATVWSNVSGMYLDHDDHVKAEFFARKADSIASTAHAKMLLGKVMREKGDMDSAAYYWEEALRKTMNLKLKRQLCGLLSEHYAKVGRYQDEQEVHALLDSLNNDARTNSVAMQRLQSDYDIQKLEKKQDGKMQKLLAVIVAAVLGIICFLGYHRHRTHQYRKKISESSDLAESYAGKIETYKKKKKRRYTEDQALKIFRNCQAKRDRGIKWEIGRIEGLRDQ